MTEIHYMDVSVKVDVCDSLVLFNRGKLKDPDFFVLIELR